MHRPLTFTDVRNGVTEFKQSRRRKRFIDRMHNKLSAKETFLTQ